ncbi:hypothetical protein D3C87_1281810 [compost metagenome]
MFCIKQQMKKYLLLIYLAISAMSFAQFQDNVFDKDKGVAQPNATVQAEDAESTTGESSYGSFPDPGDQEEGPGNPGPDPVPVDSLVPVLLISGLSLIIFYYQRKNRKINI